MGQVIAALPTECVQVWGPSAEPHTDLTPRAILEREYNDRAVVAGWAPGLVADGSQPKRNLRHRGRRSLTYDSVLSAGRRNRPTPHDRQAEHHDATEDHAAPLLRSVQRHGIRRLPVTRHRSTITAKSSRTLAIGCGPAQREVKIWTRDPRAFPRVVTVGVVLMPAAAVLLVALAVALVVSSPRFRRSLRV